MGTIHSTIPPRRPGDVDGGPRWRVVIIDSTGELGESLHRGLLRYGFDVVGQEALQQPGAASGGAERPVAVVVVDDEQSGRVDRLQALRRQDAPPTIVLSTGGISEEELDARLGNLACLLIKPVGTEEVMACVRLALADARVTHTGPAAIVEEPTKE